MQPSKRRFIYTYFVNFDDVTMTVEKGTITSTSLTVAFKNNSSSQCLYGEYFGLEKGINGIWYQVPVIIDGNYGFNDIGYKLASKEESEWTVDWEWLYGSLNTGKYRIVKDIQIFELQGIMTNTIWLRSLQFIDINKDGIEIEI